MKKTLFIAMAWLAAMGANAQQVTMLNKHTAQVQLESGKLMYLDFYGDNIFRLFQDPNGGELRDPEAQPAAQILVNNPRRNASVSVSGNRIQTPAINVTVNAQGGLDVLHRVWKADAPQQNGGIQDKRSDHRTLHIYPAEFQKGKTVLNLSGSTFDYFYGGGCQNGRFSHQQQVIAIENTNNWVDGGVASPAPYYWSTAGYGVMGYTFTPGKYDFCAKNKEKVTLMHETDYLDYFFMFDQTPVALLNDYYQLTGNPVLLPKFGFYEGHLNAYNRDYWTEAENGFMAYEDGKRYNESQKENGGIKESLNGEKQNYQFSARAAVDRYLDNDMPLGWFLPNDGYGAGYGQTETLDGNVQNLKEFGEYARSKGVEIGLWTQSDLHPKEGVEALLQRDIVKEVRDAGVRVLKTDVAWVGAGYSFGLNGVADVAQIMPYYGSQARPFIISLDGWAGTQRYAGIWTGDQTGGEWEYIRFHIPTYIGCGLSGQPNVSSDMDGIFGGKNVPVNVRDFQWKTYTPMQLNMDGWGSNPKYPQALGEPATSINRNYLKLKSILMPYTYSVAREAVDGKPMMRAMFLEEESPNDYLLGSSTRYQFMYGPSILVAPIYKNTRAHESASGVKEGDDVRDGIYLPNGLWMDAYDGKVYEGGRILNDVEAPLWKMPTYLKLGAIIPITEAHNTPNQMKNDLLKLLVVPGEKTTFSLYDDDGRTDAYLNGAFTTTLIESELDAKGKLTVTIHPSKGDFQGNVSEKRISFVMPILGTCLNKYRKVVAKVDGKKVAATVAEAGDPSIFCQNMQEQSAYLPTLKQLYIILDSKVNLAQHTVAIEVDGVSRILENPDLAKTGALMAPKATLTPSAAYSLAPQWEAVENADYYEVEFQGQIYSTIKQLCYEIDGLSAETAYSMKVRAVNKDGKSEWTSLSATTTADPLQFAIRGAKAETSCENQGGQGANKLFDFDETTIWHTDWANDPKAVPFDLTVDLKSVNVLDKLQYMPRPDAGNGTILKGSYEISMDRQEWTACGDFIWQRNGEVKELTFQGQPTARFVRFHVTEAVGSFGSGYEMYIFRVPESEFYIPGDINQDGRLDENDLTSYMNYTGLREGDGDFGGYISKGDLNKNGLIDVYDISAVAVELETGVSSRKVPAVQGQVTVKADKTQYNAGDDVYVTVSGKDMVSVNGISMAIPYDANVYEYVGIEAKGVSQMYNMTYDRLHTNGQKALYPTFVNLGEQPYAEGENELFVIHFRAKQKTKFALKHQDGMLVDKYQNVVTF